MTSFFLNTFVPRAYAQAAEAVQEGQELVATFLTSLELVKNVVVSVVLIVLFFILGKLISRRIVKALRDAQGETLAVDMVALVNRLAVFSSLFVGFAIAIQFVFELDFLQVVGFFGLGISFAFKDLLANLIAGAVIILQNRFRVGDFIMIGRDGVKGKIMEIQTRCTIMKAIDGTEIVVPNSNLMTDMVTSYTAHHKRRISFSIGIAFDADVDVARRLALKLMKAHPGVLNRPSPHVLVKNVGEFSVDLDVRFYIDPHDKSHSWIVTRAELLEQLKKAFDTEGIDIPYPIRVIKK